MFFFLLQREIHSWNLWIKVFPVFLEWNCGQQFSTFFIFSVLCVSIYLNRNHSDIRMLDFSWYDVTGSRWQWNRSCIYLSLPVFSILCWSYRTCWISAQTLNWTPLTMIVLWPPPSLKHALWVEAWVCLHCVFALYNNCVLSSSMPSTGSPVTRVSIYFLFYTIYIIIFTTVESNKTRRTAKTAAPGAEVWLHSKM